MTQYALIDAAKQRMVPCCHLAEGAPADCDQPPDCDLGYMARPAQCEACPDYLPGLRQQERTRCEVWTRVMGYHRPVSAFNAGKQAEHAERQPFREQPTGAEPPRGLPPGGRLRDQDGEWSTRSVALPGRRRPAVRYGEGAGHD